jgi:hypothetical protein
LPSRPLSRAILACTLFLVLGAVCTLPLARNFTQGVPYTAYGQDDGLPRNNVHGDHLQLYYRFWLFGETAAGRAEPFQDPYEFSLSSGSNRRVALYFFPFPLVFHLFSPLGRAAGYNAAILLSYLLSGLFMFLLVRHYTGDTAASLLGGTIFAASHYRTLAVLSGHPVGLSAFLLPFLVLCIEKVMKEKSLPWSFAGGLAFALLTDNDLHVLYLTALVSPVIVVKNLVGTGWRRIPHYVTGILPAAFPFLIIALGVLALRFPLFSMIHSEGQSITRPLSEIYRYSPGLGEMLVRHNPILTKNIYLGPALLFPLLFIVAGFFTFPRDNRERRAFGLVLFYGGLFLLSYMLAFGPRFPVGKPYTFLYHHLPKFSLIRQTSKFMLVATFALAVVSGLGFASLRRVLPAAKGAAVLAGASLLVLVDLLPFPGPGAGISLLPAKVEAYDRAFGDGRMARSVHVPLWPGDSAWSSHYLYYGTIYPSAMINGYSPLPPEGYFEDVFLPLKSLNAGQIGERQVEALKSFDLEYLVLHEESFPPKVSLFPSQMTLENLKASPSLEMVSSIPPVSVFRILGEDQAPAVSHVPSQTGVVHHEKTLRAGENVPDEDASDGRSMRIGGGEGTTVTVSRRTTPSGKFVLAARVRSEEPAAFLLRTLSSADNTVIAEEDFTLDPAVGYAIFPLEFELDESRLLRHELVKGDDSTLFLDWISMRFAGVEDPPSRLEAEELFHIGNTAEQPAASGGRALRLTDADPPGRATRGPYRLFGEGEYEVLLSAALDSGEHYGEATPVFALAVRNHLDEFARHAGAEESLVMPEQSITAAEMAKAGGDSSAFRDFTFRFSLKRPTFLSFNVRHFGHTIYLDTITIRKVAQ